MACTYHNHKSLCEQIAEGRKFFVQLFDNLGNSNIRKQQTIKGVTKFWLLNHEIESLVYISRHMLRLSGD